MVSKSPYHPHRSSGLANPPITYTFEGYSPATPEASPAPVPVPIASSTFPEGNQPVSEADEPMEEQSDDDGPAAYREDSTPPLGDTITPAPQGLRQSAETAASLLKFVADHVDHAMPGVRIDQIARDRELRDQRLRQLDPNVLAAVIWGSWKMVTGIINDPHYKEDESDFKLTVMQLIPFFTLFANALEHNDNRFDQLIQVLEPDEPVCVEADIIIFNKDDFLRREHLIEQKYKAISLDKAKGYLNKTDRVGMDSVSIAHSAQSVISLDLGECGAVQPPLPAQLLRDSIGQRRFEVLCVPGTTFFENIPDIVRKYRRWLGLCEDCGGYHPRSTDDCRLAREKERALIAPNYGIQLINDRIYWMPRFLSGDFQLNVQHYEHVFPGSVFLFQRVPPRIRYARKSFGACKTCGIIHRASDDASAISCPYNPPLIAQYFVKDFHIVEKSKSNPIVDIHRETSDF